MPLTDNLHGKLLKTHATKTTDNENDDQPTDNIQQQQQQKQQPSSTTIMMEFSIRQENPAFSSDTRKR